MICLCSYPLPLPPWQHAVLLNLRNLLIGASPAAFSNRMKVRLRADWYTDLFALALLSLPKVTKMKPTNPTVASLVSSVKRRVTVVRDVSVSVDARVKALQIICDHIASQRRFVNFLCRTLVHSLIVFSPEFQLSLPGICNSLQDVLADNNSPHILRSALSAAIPVHASSLPMLLFIR
jgi:hypothetical protein